MDAAERDWMKSWEGLGARYRCPRDKNAVCLGPLVGYAGKDPETGLQYVGFDYLDAGVIERTPGAILQAGRALLEKYPQLRDADSFCGAPMGGLSLAYTLASIGGKVYLYPDQFVEKLEGGKLKKTLSFDRHEGVAAGKKVVIVEDVCNNFSTTLELVKLIEAEGGTVVAIACLLNRSLAVEREFNGMSVCALVREIIPQYKQSDLEVAAEIAKDNWISKPKLHWRQLMAIMKKVA